MPQAESNLRRRRGSAFVTKNACNECKARKVKCDGHKPCARCLIRDNVTCEYTVSVRVSKDALKTDIERLMLDQKHSKYILDLLASGIYQESVLQQLQNGERLENIYEDMVDRQASLDLIASHGQKSIGLSSGLPESGGQPRAHGNSPRPIEDSLEFMSSVADEEIGDGNIYANKPWTIITQDTELVKHLVSLYFCWEYPTFCSLSKKQFLQDFETGRHRYCSPLLVNIIAVLGCRYSDRLAVQATQNAGQRLVDQFYAEAEILWEKEKFDPSLTTIQATGLMSLWETSRGRDNRGTFYSKQVIIMAIEMGIHLHDHATEASVAELEVQSATFWGVFVLDQAWSLTLGCCPHLSGRRFKMRPPILGEDQTPWVPYTDIGLEVEEATIQPSAIGSVFASVCELSVILCRSLHIIYAPRLPLTSREILSIYTEYLEWYSLLPDSLRSGQNSTPTVLFTHIYYHYVILLLFRPFFNLAFLGSTVNPQKICMEAADNINSLLGTYRRLYGLRRTPSFVPHISLASSIVRLATSEDKISVLAKSSQGISDLQEMGHAHAFANRAIEIVQDVAHISGARQENSNDNKAVLASSTKASIYFFNLGMRESQPCYHVTPQYSIVSPIPSQILVLAPSREELRSNGFEVVQ